jgi:hypothetical protein
MISVPYRHWRGGFVLWYYEPVARNEAARGGRALRVGRVGIGGHMSIGGLFVVAMAVALVLAPGGDGFCRLNLPQIQWQAKITGRDHRALKGYFSHLESGKTNRFPDDEVRSILLQSLPEAYRRGYDERANERVEGSQGAAGLGVRLLYVEGGREEKPVRALFSYGCFSRRKGVGFRDEGLAGLVIDMDSTTLSMVREEPSCETCPELVRIVPEKEVRINGKNIVGLNFVTSNDTPGRPSSTGVVREERINLFLFEDRRIKPAGSVLKVREEMIHDPDNVDVRTVYSGGLVFRKDMKGNIIGILSPYTVKRNGALSDKGMFRFVWDGDRGEFVRE